MFNWLKKWFHVEQTSKKEKIVSAAIAFIYIFTLGWASPNPGEGYQTIIKPAAVPPNWVFPVVWTILFILIALSGYLIWNHYATDKGRKAYTLFYLVNGFFVFLWSYFFFGLHNMASALYVCVALIILAELMIITAFYTNKKAAYLLLPYLGWLLFATYLNTAIIALNG
ncbi:tryptophan-rich sensory protein [Candidatus Peregrinibacteria bacterium]|nr:tryptophan-rich sensory protein [Candidatus Peregrinibacteria bacterium]